MLLHTASPVTAIIYLECVAKMSQTIEKYEVICKKCQKKSIVENMPDEKTWICDVCGGGPGIHFIFRCANCGFVGKGSYSSCPDCEAKRLSKRFNSKTDPLYSSASDPEAKRLNSIGDVSNAIISKRQKFIEERARKEKEKEECEKQILQTLTEINQKLGGLDDESF